MKALVIRSFQERDRQGVIELWRRCSLIVPQNDPDRDIDRKVSAGSDSFLVGLSDSVLVASCMVGYEGHRGWISYLAVDPKEQHQGYGRQMMKAAERLLREQGCPKINLQVRSTNPEVIAFYRSLGFSPDDVVSLGKRLTLDDDAH